VLNFFDQNMLQLFELRDSFSTRCSIVG